MLLIIFQLLNKGEIYLILSLPLFRSDWHSTNRAVDQFSYRAIFVRPIFFRAIVVDPFPTFYRYQKSLSMRV